MVRIDSDVLVHSFDYYELEGVDQYHQSSYKEKQTIDKCRIDYSTVFSRDSNENKVVAEAIIFCFASDTTPFLHFKEQSKVVFDDTDYVIQKVVPIAQPYSSELFSYELEVI